MIKLKVLVQPRWKSRFSDMHAFHNWRTEFIAREIKVEFIYNHNDKKLLKADVVILESRYFAWQNMSKRTAENKEQLSNFILMLKKNVRKVIWFDASDPTGSTDFPILPYVDSFFKKQVLKNKEFYTENHGSNSVRIWLNTDKGINDDFTKYYPCNKDDLHKINVGWKIGFVDYRHFPSKSYVLSDYFIRPLKFASPNQVRKLDLTFRGNSSYSWAISFQRNAVIELLNKIDINVAKGKPISRKAYLKELKHAKINISPFGYGEICYRDFETFITGGILLKPTLDHLETFPNVFIPNQTYISLQWDMSDLEEKIEHTLENYNSLKNIAIEAQDSYRKSVENPDVFIDRIASIVN